MKNYIEIELTPEQEEKSKLFAGPCYEKRKDKYKERGQDDPATCIKQIEASKRFEFAVHNFLRNELPEHIKVQIPSVKIFDKPEFDTDILIKNTQLNDKEERINVKFQPEYSVKNYGISWVFQKEDLIFEQKKEELLILGIEIDKKYRIISIGYVKNFEPYLGEMKKKELRKTKRALYFDPTKDIFNINNHPLLNYVFQK